jgi:hypothetical protein
MTCFGVGTSGGSSGSRGASAGGVYRSGGAEREVAGSGEDGSDATAWPTGDGCAHAGFVPHAEGGADWQPAIIAMIPAAQQRRGFGARGMTSLLLHRHRALDGGAIADCGENAAESRWFGKADRKAQGG